MIETEITAIAEPTIVHQGRYRLYEKPDGGLHIVYQREDKDTPDHLELPGPMINLARMAGEGKLSPGEMLRELMKMRSGMNGDLRHYRPACR